MPSYLRLSMLALWALLSSSALAAEKGMLERFDDWYFTCVEDDVCRVLQRIAVSPQASAKTDKEEKPQDVLSVAIARLGAKGKDFGIIIQTPLDVFLKLGLGLEVDGKEVSKFEYRNCDFQGCWVVEKARNAVINQLKRGKNGFIVVQLLNGKKVRISFSLIGFTKAIERLEES